MSAKKDIGEWHRGVPLSAKWPIFAGLTILVIGLGCFGVWAGVAPLNIRLASARSWPPAEQVSRTSRRHHPRIASRTAMWRGNSLVRMTHRVNASYAAV